MDRLGFIIFKIIYSLKFILNLLNLIKYTKFKLFWLK